MSEILSGLNSPRYRLSIKDAVCPQFTGGPWWALVKSGLNDHEGEREVPLRNIGFQR